MSVIARGGIKFTTARIWGWDDTAVAIASVFAVGYTGSMAASYRYGMGQKISALHPKGTERLEQVCIVAPSL